MMNVKPLFAALVLSSSLLGSLAFSSASVAQEEIESTAPGSTYEGIPNIEPAPNQDSGEEDDFKAETYDPTVPDIEGTQVESAPNSAPKVVEIPDEKSLNKSEKKLVSAIRTFEEFLADRDINIPQKLLQESEGVIIIPNMVQAGFFFGGRRGTGVMSLRNDDGTWSNPAFIKMTGGSLGLQIGAKSSDLVLIFPKRSMVHEAFAGSYKLGGNVSGTAGSLGDTPVDSTREYSKEKIYAYSRSSGFYGGISLEGSELSFHSKYNRDFYGQTLTPRQIFANDASRAPAIASSLSTLLSQAESGEFRLF